MNPKKTQETESENQPIVDLDIEFSARANISPQMKQFIETMTQVGKVLLKVSKVAVPLIASLVMAQGVIHPEIQAPSQPKPLIKSIEESK